MTVSLQLSDKQRAIIKLTAEGLTKKEIAVKLKGMGYIGTSEQNVKGITYALIELFDCKNSAGLVNYAWENGILTKLAS